MTPSYVLTDLHGHSHFSDGRATPEDFVAFRHARGLRVIALSDHDMMPGVRRAAAAAAAYGMVVVPAMETTAFFGFGTAEAEQVHVLAYYPPHLLEGDGLERTRLYQRGLLVQRRWREFVLDWLDSQPGEEQAALYRFGDDQAPLESFPAERFPGLLVLLDHMVARRRDAFVRFVKHHVRFWSEDRDLFGWSPEELVDVIRQDGAVDIVAHAARYRDKARLGRLLLGASGVEVYTSRHRPEWAARFRAFAEEYGKLWTASSDDHQNAPYRQPPHGTPVTTLERILQRPVPAAWLEPQPLPAA